MDNLKRVEHLVHKYFSLKNSSSFRFSDAVNNPFIDPLYEPYMDENYRISVELPIEFYNSFDRGWAIFKEILPIFVDSYEITYDDFRKNKIIHEKNTLKIIKLLKGYFFNNENKIDENKIDEVELLLRRGSLYSEKLQEYINSFRGLNLNKEFIENSISIMIDKINEVRFSTDKNMWAVLSLNFVDIFLSSTSEDWSSCLNLESQSFASYWASLPGVSVDKNFAMFYITNGSEKYYNGIVAPKILSRSFVLLDKEGNANIVKFYPNELIELESINKFFPIKFKYIDTDYISKYDIYPLKYSNDFSCYVYQDKTNPVINEDGSFYLKYKSKGLFTIKNNEAFEGPIFNFTGGFNRLKEADREIIRYFNEPMRCPKCGSLISRARAVEVDDELYCQSCAEEIIERRNYPYYCEACGRGLFEEEIFVNDDGEIFCERCY